MAEGIAFPVRISNGHSRMETSGEKENIRESVKIILTTEPGERLMHPDFGTKLHQFLFEDMDSQTRELISREVISSLGRWEKRITDISVRAEAEQDGRGVLRVEVSYRAADGGERDGVLVTVER